MFNLSVGNFLDMNSHFIDILKVNEVHSLKLPSFVLSAPEGAGQSGVEDEGI